MSARNYLRKDDLAGIAALEGLSQQSEPEFEMGCPYCGAVLAGSREHIGHAVNCGQCNSEFTVSMPASAPAPVRRARGGTQLPPHPAIVPCIVVSLLVNIVCAVAWFFTFIFFFVAIIPAIMAIVEVVFLVTSGSTPRRRLHRSAFGIGLMEVLFGLLSCNLISVVCGGVVLLSSGD